MIKINEEHIAPKCKDGFRPNQIAAINAGLTNNTAPKRKGLYNIRKKAEQFGYPELVEICNKIIEERDKYNREIKDAAQKRRNLTAEERIRFTDFVPDTYTTRQHRIVMGLIDDDDVKCWEYVNICKIAHKRNEPVIEATMLELIRKKDAIARARRNACIRRLKQARLSSNLIYKGSRRYSLKRAERNMNAILSLEALITDFTFAERHAIYECMRRHGIDPSNPFPEVLKFSSDEATEFLLSKLP